MNLTKKTAVAPSNIAFVKYWGKTDDALRLPANSSFSMTTDAAVTVTTVEFSSEYGSDSFFYLDGRGVVPASEKELSKITAHLDRIRGLARISEKAKVISRNSFPKGVGAASSASGFAALTIASAAAAGLSLPEHEMTVLARQGSGSACRSIPDGFVLWHKGKDSGSSYAESVFPSSHWDLCDVFAVVSETEKEVSTTEGMELASTSPFFSARLAGIDKTLGLVMDAVAKKDMEKLENAIEDESVNMHAVMMTQSPPLFYWNEASVRLMMEVRKWRKSGVNVWTTVDAGPNVHCICEAAEMRKVASLVQSVPGVVKVLENRVCPGTVLSEKHLF